MELVGMIRELWRRKAILAGVMAVAVVIALLTSYKLPSFQKRSVSFGAASSQILVDSPQSTLVAGAQDGTLTTLYTRAQIFAQYLSSPEAQVRMSRASGIPARQITASGPFSQDATRSNFDPQQTAQRANSILDENAPNRLVFAAQQDVPIITVSVQAHTAAEAVKLANASFVALKGYVAQLNLTQKGGPRRDPATGLPLPASGVTVRSLGAPEAGAIGAGNNAVMMFFVFLAVTLVGCAAILVAPAVRRHWSLLGEIEQLEAESGAAHAAAAEDANGSAPDRVSRPYGTHDDPVEESTSRPRARARASSLHS
jgi:hypothetical protein